jgi:hypothetical protein
MVRRLLNCGDEGSNRIERVEAHAALEEVRVRCELDFDDLQACEVQAWGVGVVSV